LVGRASQALGAWPWLVLALALLGALYTRASFGHWPRVYLNKPSDPLVDVVAYFSLLAIFSTVVVPPLAVVTFVLRSATGVRPALDRSIVSALLGTGLLYTIVQVDPHGYISWLFD
jgi:Na+-driven multidrug efflux pump